MNRELSIEDQIKAELLKKPFYSVLNTLAIDREFAGFTVHHLKPEHTCFSKLFEPQSQPSTSGQFGEMAMTAQCLYCDEQLEHCLRRNNICCVCKVDFKTTNDLLEHDDLNIESNNCCKCNDEEVPNLKAVRFKDHLNKCAARKSGARK